ncbi:DUF2807 domain-containing protein [Brevundimonas sp. 2R-24]|uniref:DUF2807 domain-containing protein n=1 Tax=Peiella sedimenti TaxID=3061083 RepID=A0ABT8SK69_9CAUL|nr:DUF2807 domain-containing protein [Caulobacteraceae bacterium XZ-24]
MIRPLLIIAGSGLVLSAVCFGGAAALGGRDLFSNGWVIRDGDWGGMVHVSADDFSVGSTDGDETPVETRTLAWNGTDTLSLFIPGEVIFVQSDEAGIEATGAAAVLDRLTVENGAIRLRGRSEPDSIRIDARGVHTLPGSGRLRLTVRAPDVTRFEQRGAGRLEIRGYDQPRLDIVSAGASDVIADGRTERVSLNLTGSGDADFRNLTAQEAEYVLLGAGDVESGAVRRARVDITGSGDVDFPERPEQLDQRVVGAGDITVGSGRDESF